MNEDSVSEKISENGKVKRLVKPGLLIAAAGTALAAGVKMRGKLNIAAIRHRIQSGRWKASDESRTNGHRVE